MRRRFMTNKELSDTFDMSNYMTIEALEDGLTVAFTQEIEYGIDGYGWIKLRANTYTAPVNAGQCLSFRGNLKPSIVLGIGNFKISKPCNLSGNVMSLIFYNDAANNYSLDLFEYYPVFRQLFFNCTTIQKVSQNFLPATTLINSCYSNMFSGCTSLVNAPKLPATTLANSCYDSMFYNCYNLTTAPELPATTLSSSCYMMMFDGCTNLNYIKMLATDISANSCLNNWVNDVSSTGTFVKSNDATWGVVGSNGVPAGWTVLTEEEEDEHPYAFSFNIEVEKGGTWIANTEQLIQINKALKIITSFMGMKGGDFNNTNAPSVFDLRINGVRQFMFYYGIVKDENEEVDFYISLYESGNNWFAHCTCTWSNPVIESFALYPAN